MLCFTFNSVMYERKHRDNSYWVYIDAYMNKCTSCNTVCKIVCKTGFSFIHHSS